MESLLHAEAGHGKLLDEVFNKLYQCFDDRHGSAQRKTGNCLDSRFLIQSVLDFPLVGLFEDFQLFLEGLTKTCVRVVPVAPISNFTQAGQVILDDDWSAL
jgi:hypothetical protein